MYLNLKMLVDKRNDGYVPRAAHLSFRFSLYFVNNRTRRYLAESKLIGVCIGAGLDSEFWE